ncbi:MAG: anaerobic ribonucleoside-triphosphate reductase activating protein [Desulfobacula sp. RIFOXYB2_FULL_45_6]|nr:MAG: anaerobic ribonucleoside-triphosphate reductase activating protein [Desulfobacula sp. RIFOXYB2_FULL_45_6]
MKIGGFQKNSLIDFPKTIACIIFTQGCNFSCPYCHNPDLVAGSSHGTGLFPDEADIFGFLEKRKKFLEGVVITGGEPTLQTDLVPVCRKIKDMGYKLKLDSNGSRPEILEQLFKDSLVDFISMDIKTRLTDYPLVVPGKFDVSLIRDSIRLLMEKAPDYEFRTTCARPFISREIVNEIGEMVRGAKSYILQKCSRNVKVLDPEFLKKDEHFFSDDEMIELRDILKKYGVTSTVR